MKKSSRGALGLLLATMTPASVEGPEGSEPGRLKAAYAAFADSPSDPEMQGAYLEAFPDDYEAFVQTFSEGPLSAESRDHLEALDRIGRSLPEATFRKVMKIEAAAHRDSEALDLLQVTTLRLALARPKSFATALEDLRPSERRGLAIFLTDGPDGSREEALGLAAKLEVAGRRDFARLLREEAVLSDARARHDRAG
jgi:hypothetical protein